ncbi:MAG: hypothetical protein V3S69_03175 [Dehalococcoidales bacterium]
MTGAIVREYDKRLYKKCIKCRGWKARDDLTRDDGQEVKKGFGDHESSSDGLQSICYTCKNTMNTKARAKNPVARIRHHTATRCLTQLGEHAPEGFTADMEEYLGYKITALVKHLGQDLKAREGPTRKLRDALNEGYHIDHIRPLSSFKVINRMVEMTIPGLPDSIDMGVDWEEFRKCWAMENLSAIPSAENLAKGATRTDAVQLPETLPGNV